MEGSRRIYLYCKEHTKSTREDSDLDYFNLDIKSW